MISLRSPFSRSFLLLGLAGGLFSFSPTAYGASDRGPLSIEIIAGDYRQTLTTSDFASWFQTDTRLVAGSAFRSEIEDTTYCPTDALYCVFSLSRSTKERMAIRSVKTVHEENIRSFVSALAPQINQEPKDAIFGVGSENQIIVSEPEKVGRLLNEEESADLILRTLLGENMSNLSLSLTLPTEVATPTIVSTDRERLGLKELVGEGKTNFKGSPKNRIYNINRALQQFQNVLIAPGQEFSFVDYLGEVDGEHGYLPELVIKNNQTTPEFGGGICQVSSTVFRAAIYSGLKITERRNHAYPVQYYKPYGMDATIYIPKPDLKFTNNTPGYILMQPTVDGYDLTFRFFGTRDGRTVNVDGPHILESNPDGSMKTVFTQEVNNGEGQNFIRDSFWSNYKSPSLFPHPGDEPVYTTKPKDWSEKQWKEYKAIHP
jgi:vancomycin resistance protein YoaR